MKLLPLIGLGTAIGLAMSLLFNQPPPEPETSSSPAIEVQSGVYENSYPYPGPETGYEAPMPELPSPTWEEPDYEHPWITPTSAPTMTPEPPYPAPQPIPTFEPYPYPNPEP